MAWISASNTPACCNARPAVQRRRGRTAWAIATSCSWRWRVFPITSSNTRWATTSLELTWDHLPLPWSERVGEASLAMFCEELALDEKQMRRLQRHMDRQRRAANPDTYDSQGRIKQRSGKQKLVWKQSKVHEIVAVGNTVILEKISYSAWQKQYGKSVGLRAPGMFVAHLRRTWASHGRHPGRGSHAPEQAQPVLPWLREVCEK